MCICQEFHNLAFVDLNLEEIKLTSGKVCVACTLDCHTKSNGLCLKKHTRGQTLNKCTCTYMYLTSYVQCGMQNCCEEFVGCTRWC